MLSRHSTKAYMYIFCEPKSQDEMCYFQYLGSVNIDFFGIKLSARVALQMCYDTIFANMIVLLSRRNGNTDLGLMEVNQHCMKFLLLVIQGTTFALKNRSQSFLLQSVAVKAKSIDTKETLPRFLYELDQNVHTLFCNCISRKNNLQL